MRHPIDNRPRCKIVYNLNGEIVGFNPSPNVYVSLTNNEIEKALRIYIKLYYQPEKEQGEKMTREEAIKTLKGEAWICCSEKWNEALAMAIKELEQQPSKDCIDRQELLSEIESVCFNKEWAKFRADHGSNGTRDYIINYIEELPPVTPQPKIGQ